MVFYIQNFVFICYEGLQGRWKIEYLSVESEMWDWGTVARLKLWEQEEWVVRPRQGPADWWLGKRWTLGNDEGRRIQRDLSYRAGWAGSMILSYSSATDLQLDPVETDDLEEELLDSLEDCCSQDENEEEEGE